MTEKLSLNLPPKRSTDSADETKMFFDQYFTAPLSFPANEVDAVLGFFTNRGFEKSAAQSIATVIMQQAKLDGVKVFEILDTLKGLNDINSIQIRYLIHLELLQRFTLWGLLKFN